MAVVPRSLLLVGALGLFECFARATHIAPENLSSLLLPSYDYVVVGGGISGLVVANRLTEDADGNGMNTP
jgi:hypothetical protein